MYDRTIADEILLNRIIKQSNPKVKRTVALTCG